METITLQISATSANFTRIMNVRTQQMINVDQGGTGRNSKLQTGDKAKFYCWTHGRAFNPVHTSDT